MAGLFFTGPARAWQSQDPIDIDEDNWYLWSALGVVSGGPGHNAANPWIIENYIIDADNGPFGIRVRDCSDHFVIRDTWVYDAEYLSWPDQSGAGILIKNSTNGVVESGVWTFSNNYGILLYGSTGITIENVTATFNDEIGFYLYSADSNTLSEVAAVNNGDQGSRLSYSDYNSIDDSEFSDNDDHGIYVYRSHHNSFFNSTYENNDQGMRLYRSDDNDISRCTFEQNARGTVLNGSSSDYSVDNEFYCNEFLDNSSYGVQQTSRVDDSLFLFNDFIGNAGGGNQARDDGSDTIWSDWCVACVWPGNHWDQSPCTKYYSLADPTYAHCSESYTVLGSGNSRTDEYPAADPLQKVLPY